MSFAKYIPYFTAVVKVRTNNSVIYQNKSIFINKLFDATNSRSRFLLLLFCTFCQYYFSKIDAGQSLLLEFCINIWRTRIFFSLLATNHFLRFAKSEFAASSRSVKAFAEAVRFVSSANFRGFVLFRQWGKSLM